MNIDFTAVVEFVAKRRKDSGGYSATPRLPATIEDSFEVLAIAQHLARLAPGTNLAVPPAQDAELREYLAGALAKPWPGVRTTAHLVRAGRELGLTLDREKGLKYLALQLDDSPDFRTACHTAAIAADLGLATGGYLAWDEVRLPTRLTVRDALMYLQLCKLLGRDPDKDQPGLVAWFKRCQNCDGGFGFFPSTTSYIENCHYALAGLAILEGIPTKPEAIQRFIISCQTGAGGFSRNPKAAPFLDATWHGLAAMAALTSMAI